MHGTERARVLLTTHPGLEDLVVDEVREAGGEARARAWGIAGQTAAEVGDPGALLGLTTIQHAVVVRGEGPVRTLDDVRALVAGARFDELGPARSFRVSSTCCGRLGCERAVLQGAAGAVLQRRYGTPVDLEGYEIHVCVDVYGEHAIAGIQLTRESLDRRIRRGGTLRSSLKPTVAAAMLRLAGAHRGPGRLIDPLCGAAVIPVEAARINPALAVEASDWDEPTVAIARGTCVNHGLGLVPRLRDARALGAELPQRFDYIVTDPPHGVRQARHTGLTSLYRQLLASFEQALAPNGRIAMLVVKHRAFAAAVARTGLAIAQRRVLDTGAVQRHLFVLGRGG